MGTAIVVRGIARGKRMGNRDGVVPILPPGMDVGVSTPLRGVKFLLATAGRGGVAVGGTGKMCAFHVADLEFATYVSMSLVSHP